MSVSGYAGGYANFRKWSDFMGCKIVTKIL